MNISSFEIIKEESTYIQHKIDYRQGYGESQRTVNIFCAKSPIKSID